MGGNQYSPSGVKQMRFSITTSGPFVDMSTLCISAKVVNKASSASNKLTPLAPSLGGFVQEARIYMGGTEVERMTHYGRTERMLQRFMPADKRQQLYEEGFGAEVDGSGNDVAFTSKAIAGANGSVDVIWRPMLSLCQQKNYIPTAFLSGGGAVLEFLLQNTGADSCDTSGTNSSDYELQDVKLLVDVVSVDSGFLTSFSKALLNGTNLVIPCQQYSTTLYSVTSEDSLQLVHARAYTRVNSVFTTFFKTATATSKELNQFHLGDETITSQVQIGAKLWPDHRNDTMALHYHRLLHCLGIANSSATMNISLKQFKDDAFVLATDTEAVPGQAHGSGYSTHNSSLIQDLRNLGAGANKPNSAYVTIFHETLISVSADGVEVAI